MHITLRKLPNNFLYVKWNTPSTQGETPHVLIYLQKTLRKSSRKECSVDPQKMGRREMTDSKGHQEPSGEITSDTSLAE